GERQTQYFQIQNPDKLDSDLLTYFPLDIGDPYPFPCYSENDPSDIILLYSGKTPTVTCRLTSSCINLLETKTLISNAGYSCGYSPERGSITVSNDDLSGSGSGNPGGGYTTTYLVSIYNDYGMVKQVKISSSEAKAFIPMTGYPAGYYYVNISDETGNVVTRQTVQVQ
ncbi:MAG: hypothetical protein LBP83_08720, partial [Dysgonamonadaceae bacterium]|nr:hypothetical protein [Dysgonamonadaceae bacterium]